VLRNDRPMSDIVQTESAGMLYPESEAEEVPASGRRRQEPTSFAEAPYPQTQRRSISEAESARFEVRPGDRRDSDRREGERRLGERRQGERRGASALRDEVQWTVAPGRRARTRLSDRRIFGMKASRLMLLVVALVAGGMAAFLATRGARPEPRSATEVAIQPAPAPVKAPTERVLVAKTTIGVGEHISPAALEWVDWPVKSMQPDYLTEASDPNAIKTLTGSLARAEVLAGEPIRPQKILKSDGSYLSAVLGEGMRAVSVAVAADSASGGFISPNDRVDVVLTRQMAPSELSKPVMQSEVILRNVRVLAINANLGNSTKDAPASKDAASAQPDMFKGQGTATLALDAAQSVVIINAASAGRLSLALRSAADFAKSTGAPVGGTNQAIRLTSPFWAN
jgi:pilus assembly protein CpaB